MSDRAKDRGTGDGELHGEPHDDATDELLAAVVAGDVERDDPRVAALPLERRQQLDALLRMQERLDEAADDERALLDEVDGVADGAATARAGPVVLPGPRRLASTFWLRAAGVTAVAAGLLLLVQSLFPPEPGAPPGGGSLGSGQLGAEVAIELLAPRGAVDSFAPFQWRLADAPPLARYVLVIWDGSGPAPDSGGRPLLEREVDATQWSPAAGDPPLPLRIAWRVDLRPLDGARQRGPVETAWRGR